MTKKRNFIFILLLVIISAAGYAAVVHAGDNPSTSGLVPCDTNCGFKDFMTLINKFINYVVFFLALPLSAIMFTYAGFLLLTAGGEVSQKNKAKHIFTNVVWGIVIAVAAWLIVNTLLTILGYDGTWIGFHG